MTVAAIALLAFLSLVTRWTFRFVAEMRDDAMAEPDPPPVPPARGTVWHLPKPERVSTRQDCIIVPVGPDRSWEYEALRGVRSAHTPEELRNALYPELRK